MSWLRRHRAPWGEEIWNKIDDAVHGTARHFMAARHVADFNGPKGWDFTAVRLGGSDQASIDGLSTRARVSIPQTTILAEIECDFKVSLRSIEMWERGEPSFDTTTAEEAARELAHAEDHLAFYGGAGSTGFLSSSESPRIGIGDWSSASQLVSDVLNAVAKLDASGIPGPYTLVLDEAHYYTYLASGAPGYPSARHLKPVIGSVVRSQVIRGGALFSCRGDDFVLTVGGDVAVGYRHHDGEYAQVYAIETVAAQTLTPGAVCILE
jgi:uncharacterized linocin/CFP29 family protein